MHKIEVLIQEMLKQVHFISIATCINWKYANMRQAFKMHVSFQSF